MLGCLGLAIAAGVARSTSIPVPSFAAKRAYPAGGEAPSLIGVADLNGDSTPDLVTLVGRRVSVFLNTGHGAFRARHDYQTGSSPDVGAVADLNGDGKPDLVTANRGGSGSVSVLLNRGDGSFGPRRDYAAGGGGGQQTLAIADVNGDGNRDLIVGHEAGSVSVLLGNGDGTFQPRRDYATRSPVTSLAVADLNGDAKPDLVAVGNYSALFVFLNNGNGIFQAPHRYRVSSAQSLAIGDLNGDGRPDLVTVTGVSGGPGAVSVFLNRGDGSFRPRRDYVLQGGVIPGTGGGPASVAIGDLNGDGKPDLVTIDLEAAGSDAVGFSVLLNRGDGTFGSRRDYRVWGDLWSIAIGDLNRDGRPDLVASDSLLNGVSVFLNEGRGRFQARRDYPTGLLTGDVAISDLNGDGRPDLVTANDNSVAVLLNRPGLCDVQNVVGFKPAFAKWRLAGVNCHAVIRRVYNPKVQRPKGGIVIGQRPDYGRVLPAGGKVRLLVGFGRRR